MMALLFRYIWWSCLVKAVSGLSLFTILWESSIVDVWLFSKYYSDTFVNFFVVQGVLHNIFGFHMASRLSFVERMC